MKKILIAVPTIEFIEPQTFKSIYDLEIPIGYQTEFFPYIGDQIEQVRNLIAEWIIKKGYDYLFAVDSDIAFPPDTLMRLISHDKDMVTGLYIQRIPGTHTIEAMRYNAYGGVSHVPYEEIGGRGLVPIDGCGFGCVLIKKHVFESIPYPHFVYKSALDHKDTISEDVYFCRQARDKGFQIWADTDILCDHIGSWTFRVDQSLIPHRSQEDPVKQRFRNLSIDLSIPNPHKAYLNHMKSNMGVNPLVIYDIGASVLHWSNVARELWSSSQIYVFEAMEESEFLFQEKGFPYHIGLLSDQDGKEIDFYQNLEFPGGNSYYKENSEYNKVADDLFNDRHKIRKISTTLDTVVKQKNFPPPDLIKIDVQGAEMDILKGATETLKTCQNLILELQHVEYNKGAPLKDEVISFVESLGFQLITPLFCNNGADGDYHFSKMINNS